MGFCLRHCASFGALAATLLLSAPPSAAAAPAHGTQKWQQVADLFGESDEEKAARLAAQQREQAQDAAISSLTERLSELQRTLRNVTGQIEDAQHQNVLLHQQMQRMKKDFDYRLCQLSAQALNTVSGANGGPELNCAGYGLGNAASGGMAPAPQVSGAGMPPPEAGMAPGGRQPPGTLGTLPAGTPLPQPGHEVTVNMGAVAPGPQGAAPTQGAFDSAMKLLAQGRYGEAQAAFRAFATANPSDPKAAEAVYWVGSIAYVQKDYSNAARAFAEEIKNYPDAELAPQSMLRLGQSLIALKQKQEGCTTLAALHIKYPKASASLRHEAVQSRKDAGCR